MAVRAANSLSTSHSPQGLASKVMNSRLRHRVRPRAAYPTSGFRSSAEYAIAFAIILLRRCLPRTLAFFWRVTDHPEGIHHRQEKCSMSAPCSPASPAPRFQLEIPGHPWGYLINNIQCEFNLLMDNRVSVLFLNSQKPERNARRVSGSVPAGSSDSPRFGTR